MATRYASSDTDPPEDGPNTYRGIAYADIGVQPDFDRVRRHTRRVRLLRWVLPLLLVAGIVAYFLTSETPEIDLPFDVDGVVVNEEGTILENPRLTAFQDNGDRYVVSATRAIQRAHDETQLLLEEVEAEYETPSGEIARFSAERGEFDSGSSLIILSGNVNMSFGEGVTAEMENVTVDIPNNSIISSERFQFNVGNVVIRGDRLEILENDIRISGNVETVFDPDGEAVAMPRIGGGDP